MARFVHSAPPTRVDQALGVLSYFGAIANIPAPGHYCFVAVAGNAQDPKPGLASFPTFDEYLAFVNNNNVVWRNFNVVPGPPSPGPPSGFYRLPFFVPGAFDTSRTFALDSIARLPAGSRALLEIPRWLGDSLRPHRQQLKLDPESVTATIQLKTSGVQLLGNGSPPQ